jgi:hypothetical protein
MKHGVAWVFVACATSCLVVDPTPISLEVALVRICGRGLADGLLRVHLLISDGALIAEGRMKSFCVVI